MTSRKLLLIPIFVVPLAIGGFASGAGARQEEAPPARERRGIARVDALLRGAKDAIEVEEYSKKSNNLPTGFMVTSDEIAKCNKNDAALCLQVGNAFGKVKGRSGEPTLLAAPETPGGKSSCRVGKPEICVRLIRYAELFWAKACALESKQCIPLGKELEAKGDIAGARYLYQTTNNSLELAKSFETVEPKDPGEAIRLYGDSCVIDGIEAACQHLVDTGKADAEIQEALLRIRQRDCAESPSWKEAERACQGLIDMGKGDEQTKANLASAKRAEFDERRQGLERQIQDEIAAANDEQENANAQDMLASRQANQLNAAVYQTGAQVARSNAEAHHKKAEQLQKQLDELKKQAGE